MPSGIPISDIKLPRWAFHSLLQSLDLRVDTFSIKGASSGGRLSLTKSVLSAIPSHTLACIKAPKWFYKEIDKRRRAYFWTGKTATTGAHCKVAWDTVCRPTERSWNLKIFASFLNSFTNSTPKVKVHGPNGSYHTYTKEGRDLGIKSRCVLTPGDIS
jgi:hypothetical protein